MAYVLSRNLPFSLDTLLDSRKDDRKRIRITPGADASGIEFPGCIGGELFTFNKHLFDALDTQTTDRIPKDDRCIGITRATQGCVEAPDVIDRTLDTLSMNFTLENDTAGPWRAKALMSADRNRVRSIREIECGPRAQESRVCPA